MTPGSLPSSDEADLDAHLVVQRGGFTLDLMLRIPAGSTAALLGPNGAGKSTAVAAIAGLVPLHDGHLRIGGDTLDEPARDTFVPPEQRRVGIVFQQYLLFDHLTVRDNVAFGPASTGGHRRAARAVADQWLERLDLVGLADRRPRQLSGGQAQRVALARALATDPLVLLLDEPLAALDIGVRSELRRLLAGHLRGFAGPRLLITHDPTDALLLADTLHVIESGRITQSGTPDQIRRQPATTYAAALVGTNLLTGTNAAGTITLNGAGDERVPRYLHTADTATTGPVLVTVHPTAISLHLDEPHGSPRNSWRSTVDAIEPLGDTLRVTLGEPLRLAVDITPAAAAFLHLRVGQPIWAAVKATEVRVNPT